MVKLLEYVKPGSMTFWSGLALIGFGIYSCTQGDSDAGMRSIGEGLALIGLRRAVGQQ